MANERRLIDANALLEELERYINAPHVKLGGSFSGGMRTAIATCISFLKTQRTVEAVEVVHGRWVLTANAQSNYRWNVTAECSECNHDKGEIWAGFFPGFPKVLAEDVALDNAERVKLDNYCPNCGAKMDEERERQ